MTNIHSDKILILDFGAQYTQLIARRIREIGVYCEIWAWDHDPARSRHSVRRASSFPVAPNRPRWPMRPKAPQQAFDSGLPILGICYGMQTMAAQLGGATEAADAREFGRAEVDIVSNSRLFGNLTDHVDSHRLDVWMSHGDHVAKAPPGFVSLATPIAFRSP
jgi:GMP synthase (glutamine-hydrolysing)